MNSTGESAQDLLLPAFLLGALGDLVFRSRGLGLNLSLWCAGLLLAWVGLSRARCRRTTPQERYLLLAGFALAGGLLWRADPTLQLLDLGACGVVFALLPLAARPGGGRHLLRLRMGQAVGAMGRLVGRMGSGLAPALVERGRLRREADGERLPALAVGRGILLSVPVVLVFGALLGSADRVFGEFLQRLIRVDVGRFAGHAAGVLIGAWVAAAVLGGLQLAARRLPAPDSPRGWLGRVEVTMVLGSTDLLFLGFVLFQLPYLFGGDALVQRWSGMGYADYARHGFFQLVTLTVLVLPLLLALEARIARGDRGAVRWFRVLAGVQVSLLLVIICSALHRMALYQRQFGLTQDRFFATALIAGIAVTCGWFSVTVLRGGARRFLPGALVAWGVWLGSLHLVNPDRLIARVNLGRAVAGRPLDTGYLAGLSADAVPTLLEESRRLAPDQRARLLLVLRQGTDLGSGDWRDWTLARAIARRHLASAN